MKTKNGIKRTLAWFLVAVLLLTAAPLAGVADLDLLNIFSINTSAFSADIKYNACGDYIKIMKEVSDHDHSYYWKTPVLGRKPVREASCTGDKIIWIKCDRCNEESSYEQYIVPNTALGHKVVAGSWVHDEGTETCCDYGTQTGLCSVCGKDFKAVDDSVLAPHVMGEYVHDDGSETFEKGGTKTRRCQNLCHNGKGGDGEAVQCEYTETVSDDIYNLGEETYSFENFKDSDSEKGHCFGMSATSSGYYLGKLDSSKIGCENGNIYALSFSKTVTDPICFYQGIQGSKANGAIVAGGSSYLNGRSNISSDWKSVINYVKSHEYDGKGTLQIGFRVNGKGGHAINFLRYAVVDGQERIYAYDNNFCNMETYFYKDLNGEVHQEPKATFDSYSIDCIALRNVTKYLNSVGNYFESSSYSGTIDYIKHIIFAEKGTIAVENADEYLIDTDAEKTDVVVFEVPETVDSVTITPLVDNASFTYLGDKYSFEKADGKTTGTFTFSESIEENGGSLTISQNTPFENCSCACHKKGLANLFFKIGLFFQKIFKKNRICKCGVAHY